MGSLATARIQRGAGRPSLSANGPLFCSNCAAIFRKSFARCPMDGGELTALVEDPLLGSTLDARYVIEACVGEGAMGRVYRARHSRMSRRFAVKVLLGEVAAESQLRARFAREAEAACRLDHPNVLSVVDFGESQEGLIYLVMEYIEGRPLSEVIADEAPIPQPRAIKLVRQMLTGLQHAHERGLIHRDFKPSNTLIVGDEHDELVKIVDFGLAQLTNQSRDENLTASGVIVGTPAYMSPEQITGMELTQQSDLFSLGIVFYEMLTGRRPFSSKGGVSFHRNAVEDPMPIDRRAPGVLVDMPIQRIIWNLLSKRPDERMASAEDVLAALDKAEERAKGSKTLVNRVKERAKSAFVGPPETPPALRSLSPHELESAGVTSRPKNFAILLAVVAFVAVAGWVVFGSTGGDRGAVAVAPLPIEAPPQPEPTADPKPELKGPVVNKAEPIATQIAARIPLPKAEAKPAAPVERPATPSKKVRRKKPLKRVAKPRPKPKKPPEPPPTPAPAVASKPEPPPQPKVISVGALTAKYRKVGAAIDAFAASNDGPAAKQLRARYFKIPFADALRVPALRAEVAKELDRLGASAR